MPLQQQQAGEGLSPVIWAECVLLDLKRFSEGLLSEVRLTKANLRRSNEDTIQWDAR